MLRYAATSSSFVSAAPPLAAVFVVFAAVLADVIVWLLIPDPRLPSSRALVIADERGTTSVARNRPRRGASWRHGQRFPYDQGHVAPPRRLLVVCRLPRRRRCGDVARARRAHAHAARAAHAAHATR